MNNEIDKFVNFSIDFEENKIIIGGGMEIDRKIELNILKNYINNNELKLDNFLMLFVGSIPDKSSIKINFDGNFKKFIEKNLIHSIIIPIFAELKLEFFNSFQSDVKFKTKQYGILRWLRIITHRESIFNYKNLLNKILNNKNKMEIKELYIENRDFNNYINLDLNNIKFNSFVRLELEGINKLTNKQNLSKNIYFFKLYLRNIENLNINIANNRISSLTLSNIKNARNLKFDSVEHAEIYYSSFKNLNFNKVQRLEIMENNIDKLELNKGIFIYLFEKNKIGLLEAKDTQFIHLKDNNNINEIKINKIKNLKINVGNINSKSIKTIAETKNLKMLTLAEINSKIFSENYNLKLSHLHKILSVASEFNFDNIDFENNEAYYPFFEEYQDLIYDLAKLYKNYYHNNKNKFKNELLKIILKNINYIEKEDLEIFKNVLKKENISLEKFKKTGILVNTV